jgi:hypothetical protein
MRVRLECFGAKVGGRWRRPRGEGFFNRDSSAWRERSTNTALVSGSQSSEVEPTRWESRRLLVTGVGQLSVALFSEGEPWKHVLQRQPELSHFGWRLDDANPREGEFVSKETGAPSGSLTLCRADMAMGGQPSGVMSKPMRGGVAFARGTEA